MCVCVSRSRLCRSKEMQKNAGESSTVFNEQKSRRTHIERDEDIQNRTGTRAEHTINTQLNEEMTRHTWNKINTTRTGTRNN